LKRTERLVVLGDNDAAVARVLGRFDELAEAGVLELLMASDSTSDDGAEVARSSSDVPHLAEQP
jgi:hypothetical protein